MEPKDRLIVALDAADSAHAVASARVLEPEVGLFKVGLELYLASGTAILKELCEQVPLPPSRLFLDLKLYDIPATVLGALRTITVAPAFLTVPCDVGLSGLQAIVRPQGHGAAVLGVTVLTSFTPDDLLRLGFEPGLAAEPSRLVVRKAVLAREAGCRGVVCSGRDVRAVKEACGSEFLAVCPGIRPAWSQVAGDDQQRIVTPLEAIRDGADYIVVGRPIRRSPDPVAAARRVVEEIAQGLAARSG
jgi:orotidine-5'-phosphate decarboxylase